ncbi:class I SAM-dependent methyltransferase [Nocardia sp. NPDC051030]|uniref:class I SAM-dependent methyltransferase n=1 Tax=Nocardia sp. NPDC051030 TaxID=3155162 RepID=UPI003426657A
MGAHTDEHSQGHDKAHAHGHGHGPSHGHSHTHDGIDWSTQIANLQRNDAVAAAAHAETAGKLIGLLAEGGEPPTVLDIGSGTGGQSAAFARELAGRGGGRLVLVDAVPELLEIARETAVAALGGDARVKVETIQADAAADELNDIAPQADLVWAARMVHHLPDQQAGTDRLARLVRDGGWLALSEGGVPTQCLPWDVGVGEPGLQDRLLTIWQIEFARMREDIPGAVRMPYGWTTALTKAGLGAVSSFTVFTDHPAPAAPEIQAHVASWLDTMRTRTDNGLTDSDRAAIEALLAPDAPMYIGLRDDVFILSASTIHLGRR